MIFLRICPTFSDVCLLQIDRSKGINIFLENGQKKMAVKHVLALPEGLAMVRTLLMIKYPASAR